MLHWRGLVIGGCIIFAVLASSLLVYYYSKDNCPLGTMACSTDNKCLPHKFICDQNEDCSSGEDEDPTLCADLHGSTYMVDTYMNKTVDSYTIIQNSENICEIEVYPPKCRCAYRTRIYCNDTGFTKIPRNISSDVTFLVLGKNHISCIEKNAFANYNLTLLYLQDNQISYVAPNSFNGQCNLEKLFLMENNLTSIEKGVFSPLVNLNWLFLHENHLELIDMTNFVDLNQLTWLDLSQNNLRFDNGESFPSLPGLLELFLRNNQITNVYNNLFENLDNLHLLNLRNNQIQFIHPQAFRNLVNLRELDLYGNRIRELEYSTFGTQVKLRKLYLGFNPFTYLPRELFSNLTKLKSLNLEGIDLEQIDVEMFESLTSLESIYFKRYRYCSYAPMVLKCRPISDGVSSTTELLYKPVFRYSNYMMCFLTLTGNTLVLFGRFIFRDENQALSLVIKNLAVSDSLMGLYLLLIAIHDVKYRDNYNLEAHNWMSSWTCTFTGIVGMISSEVTVLLLAFMSVDRFLIIAIPFGRYTTLNLRETKLVLITIWVFGIAIAVIPALGFISSTRFYGVNGMCFPLHIDDPYLIGWEYSALIFFGINATSLIVIICVYTGMFISIWKTRNAVSLPIKDYEFAIRFFFIVLANISCWMPIIVAKICVYCGTEISADTYGWLVVFVLPINSSVDPILYTFTTPKYRMQLVKVPACIKDVTGSRKSSNISADKVVPFEKSKADESLSINKHTTIRKF